MQHFLIKYSFDGNMMAPVAESLRVKNDDNPTKVLDIGCGPGTW
jgi:trans-aconitate methyltransferase